MRATARVLNLVINTPFKLVGAEHADVFSYLHLSEGEGILVVSNFREYEVEFSSDYFENIKEILLSNYDDFEIINNRIMLPPFGALLLRIKHD